MSKATFTSELTRLMKAYQVQREELLRQELAVAEVDTRDCREAVYRAQKALVNFIRDEGV